MSPRQTWSFSDQVDVRESLFLCKPPKCRHTGSFHLLSLPRNSAQRHQLTSLTTEKSLGSYPAQIHTSSSHRQQDWSKQHLEQHPEHSVLQVLLSSLDLSLLLPKLENILRSRPPEKAQSSKRYHGAGALPLRKANWPLASPQIQGCKARAIPGQLH